MSLSPENWAGIGGGVLAILIFVSLCLLSFRRRYVDHRESKVERKQWADEEEAGVDPSELDWAKELASWPGETSEEKHEWRRSVSRQTLISIRSSRSLSIGSLPSTPPAFPSTTPSITAVPSPRSFSRLSLTSPPRNPSPPSSRHTVLPPSPPVAYHHRHSSSSFSSGGSFRLSLSPEMPGTGTYYFPNQGNSINPSYMSVPTSSADDVPPPLPPKAPRRPSQLRASWLGHDGLADEGPYASTGGSGSGSSREGGWTSSSEGPDKSGDLARPLVEERRDETE